MLRPRFTLSLSCASLLICFLFIVTGCGSSSSPAPTAPAKTYPYAAGGSYSWVQQFAASDLFNNPSDITVTTETITSMTTDSAGDLYVCGYDLGSFDNVPNPNQVAENFIKEFDSTGKQLWSTQFGTGQGDF